MFVQGGQMLWAFPFSKGFPSSRLLGKMVIGVKVLDLYAQHRKTSTNIWRRDFRYNEQLETETFRSNLSAKGRGNI